MIDSLKKPCYSISIYPLSEPSCFSYSPLKAISLLLLAEGHVVSGSTDTINTQEWKKGLVPEQSLTSWIKSLAALKMSSHHIL